MRAWFPVVLLCLLGTGCERSTAFTGDERTLYGYDERSWFDPDYLTHLEEAYGIHYQACDGMRFMWEPDYQAAVRDHNEAVWQQVAAEHGEDVRAKSDARFPFKGGHGGSSGAFRSGSDQDGSDAAWASGHRCRPVEPPTAPISQGSAPRE